MYQRLELRLFLTLLFLQLSKLLFLNNRMSFRHSSYDHLAKSFIMLHFAPAYSLFSCRNYRLARQSIHNLPQEQSGLYQANENLYFSNRAYMDGHHLREIFGRSSPCYEGRRLMLSEIFMPLWIKWRICSITI